MPQPIPLGLASREGQPDLSQLVPSLDELEDLGLDYVELPAYAFDLVMGARILSGRMAELEAACRNRPYRFTMHGPLSINFMGPPAHQERFFDAARAFIEIAARVNASHLVLHAGMLTAAELSDADTAYGRQRGQLARLGDAAAQHGVILCIENLFDFAPYVHTPSPARLAAELAYVAHPNVQATFDISHGLIHAAQHGFDFLAEAAILAPHAKHLHLHDSFGVPALPWVYHGAEANAAGMGDLHLPVGWGSVPWAHLAKACRFPKDAIAIHELDARFWRDRKEAVAAARSVAAAFARHA